MGCACQRTWTKADDAGALSVASARNAAKISAAIDCGKGETPMEKPPILVWNYDDVPNELKISTNGGDEDFLIAVPPGQEIPWRFMELGCCSNDFFRVGEDGVVVRKNGDDEWEKTGFDCQNYKGWQFVIPCHA
jgi:hypothetical protein